MKNKLILVSTIIAAASAAVAEISLTENISVDGFVDMSYVHADAEVGDSKISDNSYSLDQFELDFLFDFSPVTARVDIEATDDDVVLEQAFATYAMDNGGAVSAGRYQSMLGFEDVEPTGLYQYSLAYNNVLLGEFDLIPGYNDGVKYTVETDSGFFGISLQDGVWLGDERLGGSGDSSWGAEIGAAFTGSENLTIFVGGAYEDGEFDGTSVDIWAINTYVVYESGALTLAAELNYNEADADVYGLGGATDALFGLVMANFAYSEDASVTGRISYVEGEATAFVDPGFADIETDWIKFTAAHNYAFTDNLLLVAEISYTDGEFAGADVEELSGAVELLFTF